MARVTIPEGLELQYFSNFLPEPEADNWFKRLFTQTPWQQEVVMIFGRKLTLERETALYGRDYNYNPLSRPALPWTPLMLELKTLVEGATHVRYDSAFCNLYPKGDSYIGPHSDAGDPEVISSLSLGAKRTITFAAKGKNKGDFKMELSPGSLLLIPREVNKAFKHCVPKSKRCVDPRISVTFRKF